MAWTRAAPYPISPFDPGFRSFEREVLAIAVQKGMAVFSMTSMGGSGEAIAHGPLTRWTL